MCYENKKTIENLPTLFETKFLNELAADVYDLQLSVDDERIPSQIDWSKFDRHKFFQWAHNWWNTVEDYEIPSDQKELHIYIMSNCGLMERTLDKFDDIVLGCACGRPEQVRQLLEDILDNRDWHRKGAKHTWYDTLKPLLGENDLMIELILQMLDNHGLLEHGSTIYGSWLSDKGEGFLDSMREIKKYQNLCFDAF